MDAAEKLAKNLHKSLAETKEETWNQRRGRHHHLQIIVQKIGLEFCIRQLSFSEMNAKNTPYFSHKDKSHSLLLFMTFSHAIISPFFKR